MKNHEFSDSNSSRKEQVMATKKKTAKTKNSRRKTISELLSESFCIECKCGISLGAISPDAAKNYLREHGIVCRKKTEKKGVHTWHISKCSECMPLGTTKKKRTALKKVKKKKVAIRKKR